MDQPAIPSEKTLLKKKLEPTDYYLLSIAGLFLFAMHYWQPNSGGFGLNLSFNNTTWIAVSFMFAIGSLRWLDTGKIDYGKTDLALIIVFLCLLIPLFWSQSPWKQIGYLKYVGIVAFIFLIINHRQFSFTDDQKNCFWIIIVIGVLIQCFIGIFQFFNSEELYYIERERPFGTFLQTNVYASLIATGLAISIYQLLEVNNQNKVIKILHWLMIFFSGLLITIVQSRTGIVGVILVVFALFVFFFYEKKIILKILVVLCLGVLLGSGLKIEKESEYRGEISEVGLRSVIYAVTLEMIKEKPLLGHGIGTFHKKYLELQGDYFQRNKNDIEVPPPVPNSFPHNELLYWWAIGGFLPVIALVVFALCFSARVWRLGDKKNKAAWLCTIPIILHTQTEYPLYHSAPHLVLLALLISEASPKHDQQAFRLPFRFIPRLIALLLPFCVCIFMVSNLYTSAMITKFVRSGEAKYLFKIVNPIAQSQATNVFKAKTYIKVGTEEYLDAANKLLIYESLVRPTMSSYAFLMEVQILKNNHKDLEAIRKRAQFLFPGTSFFNSQPPSIAP
jgi:O-antigen polymerase